MVTISITNGRDEWAEIELTVTADDEVLYDGGGIVPGGQTFTIEGIDDPG